MFSVGFLLRDMDQGARAQGDGDLGVDFIVITWGLNPRFISE